MYPDPAKGAKATSGPGKVTKRRDGFYYDDAGNRVKDVKDVPPGTKIADEGDDPNKTIFFNHFQKPKVITELKKSKPEHPFAKRIREALGTTPDLPENRRAVPATMDAQPGNHDLPESFFSKK